MAVSRDVVPVADVDAGRKAIAALVRSS